MNAAKRNHNNKKNRQNRKMRLMRRLKKRLLTYTAAASLLVSIAPSVSDAAIKVGSTDFGFTGLIFTPGTNYYLGNALNFGDDGNNDIDFTLDHGGVGTPNDDWFAIKELNTTVLFSSYNDNPHTGFSASPLRAFNKDDLITGAAPTSYPNLNPGYFGAYLTSDSGINDFNTAERYLGLQTSAGHLGWLEVQITPVGDELSVDIIDYGFEDSGAPILAGAVGDSSSPTLTSFARDTPSTSPTDADTLVFLATFDEDVTNVDPTDFTVNGTTTAMVTNVISSSASTYKVTVSGGDLEGFNGVVGLDLAGGQNITDLAGNALPGGEPVIDETYTLDNNTSGLNIHVDFTYNGIELGTHSQPYNTLAEAIEAVAVGGTITIKAGITSETFDGINKINKNVTIKSSGGTAVIGEQ